MTERDQDSLIEEIYSVIDNLDYEQRNSSMISVSCDFIMKHIDMLVDNSKYEILGSANLYAT